jgi:hypothetical protein
LAGNEHYSDFIRALVERQDQRKVSLETRGIAVVTTAGAIATLLFGLAALTQHGSIGITGTSALLLKFGVVSFAVAAAFAVATNSPLRYGEPSGNTPANLLEAWSEDDMTESERQVSIAWGKVFAAAKDTNDLKARLLLAAILSEAVGVALIAAVVWRQI